EVGCTSTANPQPARRCSRNATWSAMPSPVRLTEAMRTDSSSVSTSARDRRPTACAICVSIRVSSLRAGNGNRRTGSASSGPMSFCAKEAEMRFDGKVVIVTGAGSGIGAAAARRFSEEGAAVAADLPRDRTTVRVADVARYGAIEAVVEATVRDFGRLDVMVNNAGIFAGSTVTKTRVAEWERVMAVNAGGVFNGSRAALPWLLKTRGCIVNTASVSGLGGDWA